MVDFMAGTMPQRSAPVNFALKGFTESITCSASKGGFQSFLGNSHFLQRHWDAAADSPGTNQFVEDFDATLFTMILGFSGGFI
jgi:hypothetical protein